MAFPAGRRPLCSQRLPAPRGAPALEARQPLVVARAAGRRRHHPPGGHVTRSANPPDPSGGGERALRNTARLRGSPAGRRYYLYGGHWNSPGRYVVYASGNVSLAMLAVLVHINDAEAFARQAHVYQHLSFDEA